MMNDASNYLLNSILSHAPFLLADGAEKVASDSAGAGFNWTAIIASIVGLMGTIGTVLFGYLSNKKTAQLNYLKDKEKNETDAILAERRQLSEEATNFRQEMRKEIIDLKNEIVDLKEKNLKFQTENVDLKGTISRLQGQIEFLTKKNEDLQEENGKLRDEVDSLREEIGEFRRNQSHDEGAVGGN